MPLDARRTNGFEEIEIPDGGYVLEPGRLYLAHTVEVLGSEHYAPTFAARSSVARLGLFINLSASLGDIGYTGQWTLQLYSMNRVRVYPGINIGQMMWWRPQGRSSCTTASTRARWAPVQRPPHRLRQAVRAAAFPRAGGDLRAERGGAQVRAAGGGQP